MTLIHITIWRLYSLVLDELDLSPLFFLLRVVNAGQLHQSGSRGICKEYTRWTYDELRLSVCGRHKVSDELSFEHTG